MSTEYNQPGISTLEVEIGDPDLVDILYKALRPETLSVPSDRARVTLMKKDGFLIITIKADDLTALRAAMNSYLAWISGSLGAVDSVTSENP